MAYNGLSKEIVAGGGERPLELFPSVVDRLFGEAE